MKGIDDIKLGDIYKSNFGTNATYTIVGKSGDIIEVLAIIKGKPQIVRKLPWDELFQEDPIYRQEDENDM